MSENAERARAATEPAQVWINEPGWGRAADELLARVEAALDEAERRGMERAAEIMRVRGETAFAQAEYVHESAGPLAVSMLEAQQYRSCCLAGCAAIRTAASGKEQAK